MIGTGVVSTCCGKSALYWKLYSLGFGVVTNIMSLMTIFLSSAVYAIFCSFTGVLASKVSSKSLLFRVEYRRASRCSVVDVCSVSDL